MENATSPIVPAVGVRDSGGVEYESRWADDALLSAKRFLAGPGDVKREECILVRVEREIKLRFVCVYGLYKGKTGGLTATLRLPVKRASRKFGNHLCSPTDSGGH
jgi:hypothetical protein